MSPAETWLLVLMNVAGAVVITAGPITVATCPARGPVTGRVTVGPSHAAAPPGTVESALAVDTGMAIAIVVSAAASPIRRIRVGFMSNLPCNLHVSGMKTVGSKLS